MGFVRLYLFMLGLDLEECVCCFCVEFMDYSDLMGILFVDCEVVESEKEEVVCCFFGIFLFVVGLIVFGWYVLVNWIVFKYFVVF